MDINSLIRGSYRVRDDERVKYMERLRKSEERKRQDILKKQREDEEAERQLNERLKRDADSKNKELSSDTNDQQNNNRQNNNQQNNTADFTSLIPQNPNLSKYKWSFPGRKVFTKEQRDAENRQREQNKNLDKRASRSRVRRLMEDRDSYNDAATSIEKSNPKAAAQLRSQAKALDYEIDKTVRWYQTMHPEDFKQDNGDTAPKGYYDSMLPIANAVLQSIQNPIAAPFLLWSGKKIADNIDKDRKNSLLQDAYHVFGISKNETQMATSLGKMNTLMQQQNMVNPEALDEYQKTVTELKNTQAQFEDIRSRYVSGKGISREESLNWDNLKEKINQLQQKKEKQENVFKDLMSFENHTWAGDLVSDAQSLLHDIGYLDFGTGVGSKLHGFGANITKYKAALEKGDVAAAKQARTQLDNIYKQFNSRAEQMKALWRNDYEIDKKDLEKYQKGYEVSNYYRKREAAANSLAWYNPAKMWMAPSLLASSMSSPEKTLISMGAGATALLGSILAPETAGASIALASGAVSFASSMAAGADENFANVSDATDVLAKKLLIENDQFDKFVNEGRKELGEGATVDDILHAFYIGKYVPNDFKIRQTLLDATAGSAKQYYQGMGVNTLDSLTDAIVTCMPMGGIAKNSKVGFLTDKLAAKGDRLAFKMALRKYADGSKASLRKAVQQLLSEGGDAAVTNAVNGIRTTLNAPANFVRGITKDLIEESGMPILMQKVGNFAQGKIDKALAKMAEKSLQHSANVTDMAAAIPERVLRYRRYLGTAGKIAKDFGWRAGASMYSEGAEEGLQQQQQYERVEEMSNAYYNVLNQLPMTVLDGAKLWSSFLFKDPEQATAQERDIWEQMHGGILGALIQGGPNIAVRGVANTYQQFKLDHLILNNLLADDISDKDYLAKASIFAKELRKGNYSKIKAMLDQYESITSDMKERNKDDISYGIPSNHVANLRKLVNTVGILQQNEDVRKTAISAGFLEKDENKSLKQKIKDNLSIKKANERSVMQKNFDTYIAVLAGRQNSIAEADQFYKEKLNNIIGLNVTQSFEDYLDANRASDPRINQLQFKIEKGEDGRYKLADKYKDDAKFVNMFADLQRAYEANNSNLITIHQLIGKMQTQQLLNDMQKIKELKGGKSVKAKVDYDVQKTKDRIHEVYGDNIALDTEEDVKKFAESKGFHIDDDYVAAERDLSDASIQLQFNNEMLNKLVKDPKFAKSSVEAYLKNKKEDELLRQSVEDDFYNDELDRQKLDSAEITDDNNTYTRNGKTYVVRDDRDGVRRVYEYDSENDKLIKTNKRFDKAEWFDSRNEYDDRGKSLKKTKDQYDDYVALNDSELDKLTDEERNRLDNYRSSSMKLFEDFQKEWMDRESYESAAAKAPGLTSDYKGSIQRLADYANSRKYSQKKFDQLVTNLGAISDDGYRTKEMRIVNLLNNGAKLEKRKQKNGKFKYFLNDQEITKSEYNYARYYKKLLNPTPVQPVVQPVQPAQQPKIPYVAPETNIKYGNVVITQNQSKTIKVLDEYSASNSKYHYEWRTGNNYFIETNGRIEMYSRLHSMMEPQFRNTKEQEDAIKKNANTLQKLRDAWLDSIKRNDSTNVIEGYKNEYIKAINQMADNYYNTAVRLYGTDSELAERCKINPEGYFQTDDILKSDETINSIAKLFAHTDTNLFLPGASVISGSIIDGIARDILAGKTLNYEDVDQRMPEEVFDKLVDDLKKFKDKMETLGYVLYTQPTCLYYEKTNPDGTKVKIAGEPDLLAIAPDGNITLIDFKTSKYSFELQDVIVSGTVGGNIQTEKKREALDKDYGKTSAFGRRQQHTAREIYTNQLNAYAQMIQECTGSSVCNLQLMGITVTTESPRGNWSELLAITDVQPIQMVDLAIQDPKYVHTTYVEQLHDIQQQIDEARENVKLSFAQLKHQLDALDTLMQDVKDATISQQYNAHIDAVTKFEQNIDRYNTLSVLKQALEWVEGEKNILTRFKTIVEQHLADKTSKGNGPGQGKFHPNPRVYNNKYVKHYNRLAKDRSQITPAQRKALQVFKDWTTKKDFIKNVQFVIDFEASKFSDTAATCGAYLKFKEISYNGQILSKEATAEISFIYAIEQDFRNKLIDFYQKNKDDIKSGKIKVVLKGLSRTNGKYQYNNKPGNVKERLDLTDDQINGLLDYKNGESMLLISDSQGTLRRLDSDDYKVGSGTPQREAVNDENLSRPGIVYIQKPLDYAEDSEQGAVPHTALIALTPGKMSQSAANLIVDILANISGKKQSKANVIDQDGNQIQGPIDNSKLLHYLIRFGGGAVATDSKFQFDYVKDEDGNLDRNKVYMSYDGGNTKTIYDLKNDQDLQKLRQELSTNGYLNVQNTLLIRDDFKNSKASRLFNGVKEWFDKNPNVQSIKYSDEFIITRDDVENNTNGIAWMIKNNWFQSEYSGITDALVSTSDFEAISADDTTPSAIIEQSNQIQTAIDDQINTQPETPQSDETVLDNIDGQDVSIDDMLSAQDDMFGDDGWNMVQREKAKHPIKDKEGFKKATEDVRRICGNIVKILPVEDIIEKTQYGDVVGRCMSTAIKLSYKAENDAQYHESFHYVVEMLMSEQERNVLYNWYKKKRKNKDLSEKQIAEGLADMFYAYSKYNWQPKNKILRMFAWLYNTLNAFIRTRNLKMACTFRAIDHGKFSSRKASKENMERFNRLFPKGLNMTIQDNEGKDHQLQYIYTQKQLNEVVETLLPVIVQKQGIDILGNNIEKLKFDRQTLLAKDSPFAKWYVQITGGSATKEQLDKLVQDGKLPALTRDNALIIRELFQNWQVAQPLLESKLQQMGIRKRKDRDQQRKEDLDSDITSAVSDDIQGHADEFYSHSMSDDVAAPIQWMLSTIPNLRYVTQEDVASGVAKSMYVLDKDGKVVKENGKPKRATIPQTVNSMGRPVFLSFKSVHQRLLSELHDVKNVADLYNQLRRLGENDYMFERIAQSLYRLRYQSYIRFTEKQYEKYAGFPKVYYHGAIVKPEYYIGNTEDRSEQAMYPTEVRLVKDLVDKNGKVICKAGDILQGATYAQNQNNQTLTTLLFQSIKSQKLNFNFLFINESEGNKKGYEYRYRQTNTDQSSRQYPIAWFDYVRSGLTGLYNKDGSINRNYTTFADCATTLNQIRKGLIGDSTKININGKIYDINDVANFDFIVSNIINAFNSIGVMITKPAFYHLLHKLNPDSTDYIESLREMMTSSKSGGVSIYALISKGGVLDKLNTAVKLGDLNVFTRDSNKDGKYSGAFLYAKNQFITMLAEATSEYKMATSEMMTLGAGNTKMYMYAQNNTVSDVVDDLNTSFESDGSIRKGSILDDMKDVEYVVFEDEDGQKRGSVIAKQLLNKEVKDEISIDTDAGSKYSSDSVKFSEMGKREDQISRMQKLSDGLIIMPTLSDKSTYMSVRGFKLPGFDYQIKVSSQMTDDQIAAFGKLPMFNHFTGQIFFNLDDLSKGYQQNDVLDQFIEYFECERRNVEKTIRELGYGPNGEQDKLPAEQMIKNYHTGSKNGARFTSLVGIYEGDNFISFNFQDDVSTDDAKKHRTPTNGILESYNKAVEKYFSRPIEEKRKMVADILRHRLDDELKHLVDLGIIEVQTNTSSAAENAKYFNYKNNYLDVNKIALIANAYRNSRIGNTERRYNSLKSEAEIEGQAIVAYVFDTMCKQLMSMEEGRRFVTGMPQFFKTNYNDKGQLVTFGVDETKRYGGVGSTGSNNREDIPGIPSEYRIAEINDWEITSEMVNSLKTVFQRGEYREACVNILLSKQEYEGRDISKAEKAEIYKIVNNMDVEKQKELLKEAGILEIVDKKVQSETNSYVRDKSQDLDGVNVTDGTAFITDKMAENLLKQRGAFTENVKEAFDILRGKNNSYLSDAKAYEIVHNALISTQKYSAFGYRMQNGTPVHFYNKFALFPIFKGISYGFLKHLYDKMNDPENGVDMCMMQSAVKAGSQGSQRFDPDMSAEDIDKFSFKGHIYTQKYKWIRRQLNTDPRIDEIMSAGTQALKVCMGTLRDGDTYKIRQSDGTVKEMSANEVRDKIMSTMREIAKISWNELENKFTNQDGTVNFKNLQQFLVQQLRDRNADENILEALELNEAGDGFNVDLNSVSNMAWVESILSSKVGTDVIDIRTKGNAFYQRTVFGMDSPYKVISSENIESKLNGGKPLRMINEEGSMDAVVSIDYFMDIIPKGLQNNFKKAKQWLIDNDIISGVKTGETEWHNAEANTMSYRIPTQATSSIGALRFVDVLPIVRDTIVLPKEFTAQTGSDFDIDKLYMSTLFYEHVKHDVDFIDKDGQIRRKFRYTATSENLSDKKKQLTNDLLRTYISLLKDCGTLDKNGELQGGRYAHLLRRSIDQDTSLVKNVLKELESGVVAKPYEPYQFEMLSTQVETRGSFATGKTGIGPYALNNNNHILTQLYNVGFISDGGILSNLGALSLARSVDCDGSSILSWISALINGHVDVAKDPYVLRMNINKATYNISSLLIRLGFGRHAFYFLNNPVIRDLAQIYNECDGQIVDNPGLSPQQRKEEAEKKYINKTFGTKSIAAIYANGSLSDKDQLAHDVMSTIVDIFGDPMRNDGLRIEVNENGKTVKKTILQILATNRNYYKKSGNSVSSLDLDKTIKIRDKNIKVSEIQQMIYIASKEFEKYAQGLSDLVQYTKIDTKKQGINYQDQQQYLAKYNNLKQSTLFNSNIEQMLNDSYIDDKTYYGTEFIPMVLGNQMIHMQRSFEQQRDEILSILNNKSKATRTAVNNAMMCYIKQKAFNYAFQDYVDKYNKEHGTNHTIYSYWKQLIVGNRTLAKRITMLQKLLQSDNSGQLKQFTQNGTIINPLIEKLHSVHYFSEEGKPHYDIISMTYTSEDDSAVSNDYIKAWKDMLNYTNDKNPKLQEAMRGIANDLAIYAFMSSADSKGFVKFFKYVPLQWRKDFGYCKYMKEASDYYKGNLESNRDYSIDIDELLLNFASDNNIIPTTNTKTEKGYSRFITSNFTYKQVGYDGTVTLRTEPRTIIGLSYYNNKYSSPISKNKTGQFPPFIKTFRNGTTYADNDRFLLYKLVGVGSISQYGTSLEYPIYKIVNPKGLRMKIGSQTYQFYSCEIDDDYDKTYFDKVDKQGNKIVPTVQSAQQTFDTQLQSVIDYVNKQRGSIENAIRQSGFITKDDLINNNKVPNTFITAIEGLYKKQDSINIHYERGDNPMLSNFATRHITDVFNVLSGEELSYIKDIDKIKSIVKHSANTVENAFQAIKVLYSTVLSTDDKIRIFNSIITEQDPKIAKAKGASVNLGEGLNIWRKVSNDILSDLMYQSFAENEEAKQLLINTGNVKFTHINRKGEILDEIMKKGEPTGESRFANILTKIRTKLQEKEGYVIEPYSGLQKTEQKSVNQIDNPQQIEPKFKGAMSFSYGTFKRNNINASTTLEAIKIGERTATTRYVKDGNISYWKRVKVGDVIEFHNKKGEKVYVMVTKPLTLLSKNTSAETWSQKEGWSTAYFDKYVKPQIEKNEAYQMEYKYLGDDLNTINSRKVVEPYNTDHLNIISANNADKKATIKGSMANKFIGFADGINGSSTANYAKQAGEYANVGNYNSNDVIFVSIPGKRGDETIRHEQQNRTIQECLKAIKSGATLLTDNKEYTENSNYNEGEKRLAEALTNAGATYSEIEKDGQKIGKWVMVKQQPSTNKKYYYYNSKPIKGVSVKDLKIIMQNISSFVTEDVLGEDSDKTTQYIKYSDFKQGFISEIINDFKEAVHDYEGLSYEDINKNVIYYDKSKKSMVVKSKAVFNVINLLKKIPAIMQKDSWNQDFANVFECYNLGEFLYKMTTEDGNAEIGSTINKALYGEKHIIDENQLELFNDQSVLTKLAESVGITVEQLKQNLEARQEFIEKSLKDYPTNEALDTLADEIDEQCK